MNTIKKLWPHAFKAGDVKSLVISIVIYVVANLLLGVVFGLLDGIPLVGFVFGILGWLLGIYCFAGIVLAILSFLKVLK